LNTFAYTGSLGVAAAAGGARQVIQTGLEPAAFSTWPKIRMRSTAFPSGAPIFWRRFLGAGQPAQPRRRAVRLRLCRPAFLLSTGARHGRPGGGEPPGDQQGAPAGGHGGWLVAINNALFLSGAAYWEMLQGAVRGWLSHHRGTDPRAARLYRLPRNARGRSRRSTLLRSTTPPRSPCCAPTRKDQKRAA
jgi:23S rRNA (cytosine1962-C5)-methyltransferase